MDDPDNDLSEEKWHLKHMLASHEKEVEKTFSQISKVYVYQQDTDFIAHHLKLGSLVMLIAEELLEQDYHAAYVKLNLHFVTMGISGLVDQADRVRQLNFPSILRKVTLFA